MLQTMSISEAPEPKFAVGSEDAKLEAERRERCRELARSGETKCRLGQVRNGVEDLEQAFSVGTSDLKLLSIVCSQLGNAYIELEEYQKAVEKHQEDRALSTILNDVTGEAKACCNLACAYRLLRRFQEAIHCSERCVQLCRRLNDKEKESLAMYSLATCYHCLAKETHLADFSDEKAQAEARSTSVIFITKSIQHYLYYIKLLENMPKLPNYNTLRGRTLGNLGNLYYLLNQFAESISFHEQRLDLAVLENDREAIIRAHSNIGNAHLVGGDPLEAEVHYREMNAVAEKDGDQVSVVKALFGLATAFSLQKNYKEALQYYTQMNKMVPENDDDAQLKALFGLTFANRALGHFRQAQSFAEEHLKLAERINDAASMDLAQGNIDALTELMAKHEAPESTGDSRRRKLSLTSARKSSIEQGWRGRSQSDATRKTSASLPEPMKLSTAVEAESPLPSPKASPLSSPKPGVKYAESSTELFSALEKSNRGRIDEQRAVAPSLSFRSNTASAPPPSLHGTPIEDSDVKPIPIGPFDRMRLMRRDRMSRQSSDSSQPASPANSARSSRRSSPSRKGSPPLNIASSQQPSVAAVREDTGGDQQMGLSDFLDFLDEHGGIIKRVSTPPQRRHIHPVTVSSSPLRANATRTRSAGPRTEQLKTRRSEGSLRLTFRR